VCSNVRARKSVRKYVPGLLGERLVHLVEAEEVVAGVAGEPLDPAARERGVERAVAAAVGIGHRDALVAARQLAQLLAHGGRDAIRPVVQLRRQGVDVEVEAAPPGDRAHVQREAPQATTPTVIPGT
jgi:hypothetical protein